MIVRLLWRELCSIFTFEFRDAWLTLLLLWIHIRYQNQVVIAEDRGEDEDRGDDEADDRGDDEAEDRGDDEADDQD